MWLHNIIEHIASLRNSKLANRRPGLAERLDGLISSLMDPDCVCVHAGDYSTFHSRENREKKYRVDITKTKFPFHKIFLTYTLIDSEQGMTPGQIRSTRRAILIDRTFDDKAIFLSFGYVDHDKSWMMDPFGSIFSTDDAEKSTLFLPIFMEGDIAQQDENSLQQDHLFEVAAALSVLDILSCKNVSLEKVDAPAALNKKRTKKGRVPIFSYNTLAVNIGKTPRKGADAGSGGQSALGSMPLHLCRGHWKEYTPDAPLFGRAVGRYWFEPHMRGNKEHGIRKKDYMLKFPENGESPVESYLSGGGAYPKRPKQTLRAASDSSAGSLWRCKVGRPARAMGKKHLRPYPGLGPKTAGGIL